MIDQIKIGSTFETDYKDEHVTIEVTDIVIVPMGIDARTSDVLIEVVRITSLNPKARNTGRFPYDQFRTQIEKGWTQSHK